MLFMTKKLFNIEVRIFPISCTDLLRSLSDEGGKRVEIGGGGGGERGGGG